LGMNDISRFQRSEVLAGGYLGHWPRLLHLRACSAYDRGFIRSL